MPFNYYLRFAPGSQDRRVHLKDGEDLLADIDTGKLPAVSFYKPAATPNKHPSYTDFRPPTQGRTNRDFFTTGRNLVSRL